MLAIVVFLVSFLNLVESQMQCMGSCIRGQCPYGSCTPAYQCCTNFGTPPPGQQGPMEQPAPQGVPTASSMGTPDAVTSSNEVLTTLASNTTESNSSSLAPSENLLSNTTDLVDTTATAVNSTEDPSNSTTEAATTDAVNSTTISADNSTDAATTAQSNNSTQASILVPTTAAMIMRNAQTAKKCPNDWYQSSTYNNKCYKMVSESEGWFAARYDCSQLDGSTSMLAIDSYLENLEISQIIQAGDDKCGQFYIGLFEYHGGWAWENGDYSTYRNWNAGYPQKASEEDCVAIDRGTGQWVDQDCNIQQCYICQMLM